MKCALVGDFNAKTAVLEDFSKPDETFLNVMDEHFMSFSIKFTNSFSISKNASIDEYRKFSGGMYTHPNKRSLLNT
jgi:hypothetical protein